MTNEIEVTVLMTCCNSRYATVAETLDHKCPTVKIKGQQVVKGIKGIRKFYETEIFKMGWHVMLDGPDGYQGYNEISARAIINSYNAKGYAFAGWTGNGLHFTKG